MIQLHFPEPRFRIRNEGGQPQIFDPLRSKWIALKPEEWVRQNFIQWLIHIAEVPSSSIAVEKEIQVGSLKKRFDLLIMDRETRPWMLVELKSDAIEIDEKVLMQVLSYNSHVNARFLAISNGKICHVADKEKVENPWLSTFPSLD